MNCCHIKNVFLYKNNLLSQSHYFVYQKTVTIKSHVVWHILFLFFFRNCPNFLYSPFPWNKLKLYTYFSLFLFSLYLIMSNLWPPVRMTIFCAEAKRKHFVYAFFVRSETSSFDESNGEEKKKNVGWLFIFICNSNEIGWSGVPRKCWLFWFLLSSFFGLWIFII